MTKTLEQGLAALSGDIVIGEWLYTADGGVAELYTNNTGSASVKGTVVIIDPTDGAGVVVAPAGAPDFIGVVYEDGVADGQPVRVVVRGDAYMLLEDSTASTIGYWVGISETQNGRVDATLAAPAGGTIAELNRHFEEIGHCRETKTAGTDVLCLVHMHFN